MKERTRGLGRAAFLVLVVSFVYAFALGNRPVWDDTPLVTSNPYLGSLGGLGKLLVSDLWTASGQGEPSSYYRPFAMLAYWLNARLGGMSAISYRVGNVLLHGANAVLLAVFVERFSGVGRRAATLVALLWALAPVVSEPVYWLSGRFDLLVVTAALGALLLTSGASRAASVAWVACIAAGLLSKESFVGFLPILVAFDLGVRRTPLRPLVPRYAGAVAVLAAYFAARRLVHVPSLQTLTATGPKALAESFLFLVRSLGPELLVPTHLDPFRPYRVPSPLEMLGTTLALVSAGVVAIALEVERSRAGASAGGGERGLALLGWLWFVASLLPTAVVGPHLDMVGDRYLYLPALGAALFAAALVSAVARRARASRAPLALASFTLVALAALGAGAEAWATARRGRDWADDRALAESSLRSHPDNAYALYSLGALAAERGDYDRAADYLARAVERGPSSWRTWDALCYLHMQRGELEPAAHACEVSLARNPANPRAWVNLASVHARARRWPDAAAAAERAIALKPNYPQGRYMAALCAANLGDLARARAHVAKGLRADPTHRGLRDLDVQLARAR